MIYSVRRPQERVGVSITTIWKSYKQKHREKQADLPLVKLIERFVAMSVRFLKSASPLKG